jgi:hypothetical protein
MMRVCVEVGRDCRYDPGAFVAIRWAQKKAGVRTPQEFRLRAGPPLSIAELKLPRSRRNRTGTKDPRQDREVSHE